MTLIVARDQEWGSPTLMTQDDYQRAERAWRRFSQESLSPSELVAEIRYWSQHRAMLRGDLASGDLQLTASVDANASGLRAATTPYRRVLGSALIAAAYERSSRTERPGRSSHLDDARRAAANVR